MTNALEKPDRDPNPAKPQPRETLLVAGVRGGIHRWQKYVSPYGMPMFWARSKGEAHRALNRIDLALIAFLLLSIGSFLRWPDLHFAFARALVAGMAVYRVIDIAIGLASIGIFGSLREGIAVEDLPRHHVQRMLIAALMAYVELMFWFALINLWISTVHPFQYTSQIANRQQAFFVSMETLTTVGYGTFSPIGSWAMVAAGTEAVLGLFIYAIVVSALIGSIKEAAVEESQVGRMGYRRFTLHTLGPLAGYLCCCALAVATVGV